MTNCKHVCMYATLHDDTAHTAGILNSSLSMRIVLLMMREELGVMQHLSLLRDMKRDIIERYEHT